MIARAAALVLVFAVLSVVEAVVAPAVAVARVPPDLTVLAVVGLGLADGPVTGARAGFLAGLARDLLASTTGLMGPWMLLFTVVGYGAGLLRHTIAGDALPSHVLVGAVGALTAWLGVELLGLALGVGAARAAEVPLRALVAAGWAVVLAPLVCRGVQRVSARTAVAGPPTG